MKTTHTNHVTHASHASKGDTTMEATNTNHASKGDTTMEATNTNHVTNVNTEGDTNMQATNETKPVTKVTKAKAQAAPAPALPTATAVSAPPEGLSRSNSGGPHAARRNCRSSRQLAVPLSIQQRRQELKMKAGGDWLVADVLGCAARYNLVIPGVSQAEAVADVTLATNLQPLMARLQLVATLVNDVILQARSRAAVYDDCVHDAHAPRGSLPCPAAGAPADGPRMATQYKDAPTSLRKKEAKQLSKARTVKKTGKATEAASAQGAATSLAATAPPGTPTEVPAVAVKPASS